MKLFNNKTLMGLLAVISIFGYIMACTNKDQVLPKQASGTTVYARGTAVLLPGTMTAGDTTQWKLDQVHSSVLWSGAYEGAAGLLTGRFNMFGVANITPALMQQYTTNGQPVPDSSWAFYENEPSKTYFNGYVQVNTSNTGEPGRDSGCNISATGTVKIIKGVQNLQVNNIAQIHTTKVEFDPNSSGYIVTMDMTWQGLLTAPKTESIVGKLVYVPVAVITTATGHYKVFGLQLTFQFNKSDFGITSTNVGDNMTIQVNVNFNNK